MDPAIHVAPYQPTDVHELMSLFHATVHHVNAKDYDVRQLNVWAPETIDAEKWHARLLRNFSLVARNNHGIVGFAELTPEGHLDMLYVHKDFQRQSVGTTLVRHIERHAAERGQSLITTDASITARPFFEFLGYSVVSRQTVVKHRIDFINYQMRKTLTSQDLP